MDEPTSIRFDRKTFLALKQQAKRRDLTVSQIVRMATRDWLSGQKKRRAA